MNITRFKLSEILEQHGVGQDRRTDILKDIDKVEIKEDLDRHQQKKIEDETEEKAECEQKEQEERKKRTRELLISQGYKQPEEDDQDE